jgi:hypothetical protein
MTWIRFSARTRLEGFAQPTDFLEQWETYLLEVAQRRRQMGT